MEDQEEQQFEAIAQIVIVDYVVYALIQLVVVPTFLDDYVGVVVVGDVGIHCHNHLDGCLP
jgi:hypothetical protein